jgi:SAM-dependent methyltransferase
VLDIGAGSGLHSLELVKRGFQVTPIDISPDAIHVMCGRGLQNAVVADIWAYEGGPFDTLLLLANGLGLVGGADGIPAFLERVGRFLRPGGQLLAESLDVTKTGDPAHLAYQMRNRQAGLPIGMTSIQIEFRGVAGPYICWPHFDQAVLRAEAARAGWQVEIVVDEPDGEYLARLTR